MPDDLFLKKISSYQEYLTYLADKSAEFEKRAQYVNSISSAQESFTVPGKCFPCQKSVDFLVDYQYSYKVNDVPVINWRERLVCPKCWLINRHRGAIHLFESVLSPKLSSRVYIAEQITPLYKWLLAKYDKTVGSEFLSDSTPLGQTNEKGLRNEDFTKLSFGDEQFDFVISNDVFEHIPHYQKAFSESFRVIKHGGALFFTVPFRIESEKNMVRASLTENGETIHHYPPEYHGNSRFLAYYHFGWEMIDQVRNAGFSDIGVYLYWSKEFGYLGREQTVFIARK